ncbi:transglycosylase SLT domain-containing protein [Robiginitalea sp. IMCC43444]|uniref:transglycosylase SLT domain-containing protein n=1 Tax=Robiginitalea sp. IMCC43444 TaxID=3459121 RepID=UPI0040430603
MVLRLISFLLLLVVANSCLLSGSESGREVSIPDRPSRDLDQIREDGKLRALIAYSATSYFLYKGQTMGYEYELLRRLANHLDLELEIRVARDLDQMLEILQKGQVDIVAHGLAVTQERKKEVAFADYLYLTKQVLVQRKPANWRSLTRDQILDHLVQDPVQLIGDTVSVRKNSSYLRRLENLSREIGGSIIIDTLEGNLSTDEIIKQVVDKKIKYTVADRNLARINASNYPILDISVPVSFSQRIAWALPKGANKLLEATNDWIASEKRQTDFYVIYNKYFKNSRSFNRRIKSEFYSLNKDQISAYDTLIKKEARELGWDWRLLASLVYQESRFNPEATSWTGAQGLMQLMPATAAELGVEDRTDPVQSINGGTKYLSRLVEEFAMVPDSIQRIKFALASYNCGYNHVKDAQKLAAVKGLNEYCWDGNVDSMILALSYPKNYYHEVVEHGYVRGVEPYRYVNQIFDRYQHYTALLD